MTKEIQSTKQRAKDFSPRPRVPASPRHIIHASCFVLLSSFVLSASSKSFCAEPPVDLSRHFGFRKLEVFKLELRSSNLVAGDLNKDGLTDLVLVDNSHSRIDLLQQRALKPPEQPVEQRATDVNAIEHDWRFEHRKLPVDKEVSAMVLGDFNGDGRTDIAWFGLPDRLAIRLQPETGDWTAQTTHRLPDVLATSRALAAGDLNHDGKDDLVVLGKNVTYVLYQQAEGGLAVAQQLMNTSASLASACVADLDGDGRNDLSYLSQEDREHLFCVRLQDSAGRLGPELRFDLKLPRAVTLAEVDGRPGGEILVIEAATNRLRLLQLRRPEAKPGELAGRLIQYGFGQEGADRDRDLATGDLDGDGLADVVVTDPESAQMIVYRQQR
ncbi:MAG: FG-GAP and VCBS repeat-containing protein, partial [Planctomycetaceae bacterium]